ncbi:MAG: 4Fe-4S binding protein [Eubacteriaceae bacterium]|nr:4Fe-4S binding protein [Eubacteriaceae bacterium]
MKQLLILSGKGGTGKTTVASAFIKLAKAEAYADCDVDAPNLHLVAGWQSEPEKTDYYGMPHAKINPEKCTGCDRCREHCRFDAIVQGETHSVNRYACEGCGVCVAVCPEKAVALVPAVAGELMLYKDKHKTFSSAQLKMGSGTSGKLVTEVKKQIRRAAGDVPLAIIDGSPGIGCPVIASVSGVSLVLIVAEPTASGFSDMMRIVNTAAKFGTKIAICVNKYDINPKHTEKIEKFCEESGLPFVGKIPYDTEAVKAINNGRLIVDVDCISGRAVREVYQKTMGLLLGKGYVKNVDQSFS